MNKKIVIAIIIIFLGLIISFIVKFFIYNYNHDVLWKGERITSIGMFAGCNYSPHVINADDKTFSELWEDESSKYEFSFEDVAKKIPKCEYSCSTERCREVVDLELLGAYQKKFLNREFTALKDEPVE